MPSPLKKLFLAIWLAIFPSLDKPKTFFQRPLEARIVIVNGALFMINGGGLRKKVWKLFNIVAQDRVDLKAANEKFNLSADIRTKKITENS